MDKEEKSGSVQSTPDIGKKRGLPPIVDLLREVTPTPLGFALPFLAALACILAIGLFAAEAVGAVTESKIEQARKAIEKVYEDQKAYERLYSAHPEAGMEQELKRILEVARMKNPQILPTKPSRYTPHNMPGNVVLWSRSTYVAGPNHRYNSLAWIDKNRVLLVGSDGTQPYKNATYIWDTARGTITPYGDHKFFCYADGYLVSFPSIDKGPIRRGKLGKEKELEFGAAFENKGLTLDLECRESVRRYKFQPLGPASGILIDLGKQDGMIAMPVTRNWLDRHPEDARTDGTSSFDTPLLLVNSRFPKGFPLPIWAVEEIRSISYSDFRGRYVVTPRDPRHRVPGLGATWPNNLPRPVYLVGADGAAETVAIPETAGWHSIKEAAPTRAGLAFLGYGAKGNPGGGLFLYDGNEVMALDLGLPENLAVSSDGCKVAYAINNDHARPYGMGDSRPIAHFKFIHFCQE